MVIGICTSWDSIARITVIMVFRKNDRSIIKKLCVDEVDLWRFSNGQGKAHGLGASQNNRFAGLLDGRKLYKMLQITLKFATSFNYPWNFWVDGLLKNLLLGITIN
ncbi:hypothetical protein CM15mP37_11520 [bacterium]|nr:MAG: hypothetical protein CM15mP37_11520 [bacterium]